MEDPHIPWDDSHCHIQARPLDVGECGPCGALTRRGMCAIVIYRTDRAIYRTMTQRRSCLGSSLVTPHGPNKAMVFGGVMTLPNSQWKGQVALGGHRQIACWEM